MPRMQPASKRSPRCWPRAFSDPFRDGRAGPLGPPRKEMLNFPLTRADSGARTTGNHMRLPAARRLLAISAAAAALAVGAPAVAQEAGSYEYAQPAPAGTVVFRSDPMVQALPLPPAPPPPPVAGEWVEDAADLPPPPPMPPMPPVPPA